MNLDNVKAVIKCNYPPVNYTELRESLDWLIEQAELLRDLAEEYNRTTVLLDSYRQARKEIEDEFREERYIVDESEYGFGYAEGLESAMDTIDKYVKEESE